MFFTSFWIKQIVIRWLHLFFTKIDASHALTTGLMRTIMLHKIKEVLEHSQTNKISLGGVNSLKVKVQQNPANCNSQGKQKMGPVGWGLS